VNLDNVRRDDWIVAGLALLLALDLLILPWFSFGATVTIGSTSVSFGGSLTATDAPDGWLGVLGVLAAVLVIVDLAVERLSPQTEVPAISGSRTMTRMVLAGAAALFLGLKFLFHINHFSNLGFGFWAALVLAVALVYFALQARQGEGMAPPVAADPVAPPTAPTGPSGSSGPPLA
jgi:hypothetical protein